jgi:hypothetical protein
VVHDGARRRSEVHCPNPDVSIQVQRQDEIAIDVRAARGNVERLAHRHDQIRLTELPSFRELGERRQASRVALEGTVGDPSLNRGDLVGVQLPGIGKRVIARSRFPGRHGA